MNKNDDVLDLKRYNFIINSLDELYKRVELIESMLKEFYNICNHLFKEVHKND